MKLSIPFSHDLIKHVKQHGGATLNVHTLEHVAHKHGYMVSSAAIPETGCTISEPFSLTVLLGNLMKTLKQADTSDWYIGLWLEGDNICIDASQHMLGLERAIHTGRARKQRAIYDCQNNSVLPL